MDGGNINADLPESFQIWKAGLLKGIAIELEPRSQSEYASESEVIRDGLRALQAREKAVDAWLRNEIAPIYDALQSEPARAKSISELKATLAAEHENATKTL